MASLALRVRRAGRSPAGLAARAGRAGAGGSWPFRGPHSFGSGTPGGSIVRRFGPPCSDSPGSLAPGHAFATRAARTKSLRRGWPGEALGQQQRHQVRVPVEADAEHLVGLALVPRGTGVHADRGGQHGRLVRNRRTDQQPPDAPALGRQRGDMGADAEAGAGFVHGAQPVEIGAAEPVARRFEGGDPGRGRHIDGQQFVRLLRCGVLAEDLGDGVRQPVVLVGALCALGGAHFRPSPDGPDGSG